MTISDLTFLFCYLGFQLKQGKSYSTQGIWAQDLKIWLWKGRAKMTWLLLIKKHLTVRVFKGMNTEMRIIFPIFTFQQTILLLRGWPRPPRLWRDVCLFICGSEFCIGEIKTLLADVVNCLSLKHPSYSAFKSRRTSGEWLAKARTKTGGDEERAPPRAGQNSLCPCCGHLFPLREFKLCSCLLVLNFNTHTGTHYVLWW